MIQQVWQAHLLHLPKQKNHIAHALCTHLHMLLHLFPLPMKQSYKGSPSLSLSPSYPLGLFLSLPDFFTFQTYISTKVPKYPRFCLQSSPLGYSYHTIFFSTEKKETGWPLVRMVSHNFLSEQISHRTHNECLPQYYPTNAHSTMPSRRHLCDILLVEI